MISDDLSKLQISLQTEHRKTQIVFEIQRASMWLWKAVNSINFGSKTNVNRNQLRNEK